MPHRRIRATVALATALVTATLVGGAAIVLERARHTAWTGAQLSLQRTAQVVENALNRQLLQVDSALAGLPGLFAVTGEPGAPLSPERATRVLQGLNVQSLSFRDLVLVRPDGTPWASARPRSRTRPLPISREYLLEGRSLGATMVAGPARNPLNGEWALYLARPVTIPGAGEIVAVAEVPLATLTSGIAEAAGDAPNLRVALETADGRLLASLPHDERAIGRPRDVAVSRIRSDGVAFDLPADGAGGRAIAAARQTLYGDIRVAVTLDAATALADWSRDRDRLIAVVALAELLVLASAAALFWALRRQERLEAERQLARSQLENAIEAMSDGFVMWDRDDRLVTCNGKYRELYDKSAAFIRPGATFEEIMRGGYAAGQYPQAGPDIDAWFAEMVAWHQGSKGAMERLLPDGRWLLVTERRTASGEIVGIRTDITALKGALDDLATANARAGRATEEAHAARVAAEAASEAKTEFLASMSHEIRTPLNGVLGYTDLLLDDPALAGDQRRHVRRIQTAGSALLTVVNDILDFSKIEAGQVELEPQAFPLAALVDNTVSITRASAERKGLAFRVEMGPDLPAELVGDHDRLRQVLLNLLNNAIKFTQAGSVTLSLACAPGSTDEVCRVLFRVTDTGLGIPKDKMHRLFQRFSQVDGSVSREYGGTGLGLAISKRLVEIMGGEIGVESEHLQGASFWFTAPLARVRAAPEPVDAAPAPAGAGGARVLLVEDLEINQELARAVLEAAGHRVDVVGDGGDAVMAVRAKVYDVVLMDVQMPGMDGITATRHIREADHPSSRIPIVAMTANVLPQQVAAFREAGMDDHVGKPFKRPELLAKVARWGVRAPEPEGRDAPAGGAGPVLDRAVYDTMRELLGSDKLDAMLERLTGDLLRRFCEGGPDADRRRLAGDAHATISTAGMLGFTGLSELCREVETACQDGADVGPLMERLDAATRAVIAEIDALRAA